MRITNETPFLAGWSVGFRPDAREVLVIAVKGTFQLSSVEGDRIAGNQNPLLESDVFGLDPATDAPCGENDFALFKPECDVILKATAYAPGGQLESRISAGMMVGERRKLMSVVGERHWYRSVASVKATRPKLFSSCPISYDVAFGGTDIHPSDPTRVETFLENPVGLGFCRFSENLEGLPLPATEELGTEVVNPVGRYRPMAFGPIGRNWLPRYRYAGTYDARWMNEKLPFLPDDFDYRYFQAAPEDQRIPYPKGGEPIVLANLTPEGRVDTTIPRETVWVSILRARGESYEVQADLDTIVIEPDEDRLNLTWRVTCALDRDPFEVREIVVERGKTRTAAKSRARIRGKAYYSGLDQLPQERERR